MAKCNLCGVKIRAYFDICENCSSNIESSLGGFGDDVGRVAFIREMGINV